MHIILHFVTSNDWYQNPMFFYGTSYRPRRSGACSLSFSLAETNGRPTPAIDYNDWYHFWYQFSVMRGRIAAMKCQGRVRTRRRRRLALDTLGGCTLALAGARLFLAPLSFLRRESTRRQGRAGRRGRLPPRKRGLPRAAMDGRAWRRSVKRRSASLGAARLANAAARPGAAREAQGGRACSVRAHDAPRRGVGRLWRLRRRAGKSFFESSSREALAPCAATHLILRSSVRERHSVRAERAAA